MSSRVKSDKKGQALPGLTHLSEEDATERQSDREGLPGSDKENLEALRAAIRRRLGRGARSFKEIPVDINTFNAFVDLGGDPVVKINNALNDWLKSDRRN